MAVDQSTLHTNIQRCNHSTFIYTVYVINFVWSQIYIGRTDQKACKHFSMNTVVAIKCCHILSYGIHRLSFQLENWPNLHTNSKCSQHEQHIWNHIFLNMKSAKKNFISFKKLSIFRYHAPLHIWCFLIAFWFYVQMKCN